MSALEKLVKYELRKKNLLSVKPEVLGDVYEAFERFDSEAISQLTIDYYTETIVKKIKKIELVDHENYSIIKWINKNPNQDIESYLSIAIKHFIYDLQCKANVERCSIGVHVKQALQSLSAQGLLEYNESSICFKNQLSTVVTSQNDLKTALLKTRAWTNLKNTISMKYSTQAVQHLEQVLRELQDMISCFNKKDLIGVIFQQISFFQTQVDLDGTDGITEDAIEYEMVENESAMQISTPLHNVLSDDSDSLFDNSDELIKFINKQNWRETVKQKCIAIIQAIINDEGEVGVQKRIAEQLGIPPQTVNDCMQRLRTVLFENILKIS